MRRIAKRLRGVLLVGALCIGGAGQAVYAPAAFAQVPRAEQVVPTPEQLRPARELPAAGNAHPGDIFQAPEPGPCPLADSTLTLTLTSVSFTGATNLNLKTLEPAFAGEIGKTLPVAELCAIRDRAAAILFHRGILARVEIPAQRIAGGALSLDVIEARIVSVRYHGDAGPSQPRVEALLEHLRGMTPFDLNVAQRYLLLAADIPGVQLSAAVRPSAQGRGAVDLDISIARKPVDAALNGQNYGSKTLGREAVLGRIDLNGLTPLGDKTSIVLYTTTDLVEQRVVQVLEDIHPFDDGLILHGTFSYANTRPGSDLKELQLRGNAYTGQLALNYPLVRKRRDDLNLLFGMDIVDEKTTFSDTGGTLIDDRLRVLFLRAQGDTRGSLFNIPYDLEGGVEVRRGLDILGASHAGSSTLSRVEGHADALVGRFDAKLEVRPTSWLDLVGAVVGQDTDQPLLTFEELAIGNLTIGRGYDPSSVAGDRGVAGSFEPRFGPWSVRPWMQVSPYAFYDVAYVKYIDSVGDSSTVHSAGAGLRATFFQRLDIDVTYAVPFDKPTAASLSVPFPRVLASATLRY